MNRNGMRPVHPGEILSEEFLKPLGMTIEALARSLNEPEADVSDVVNQKGGVSAGLAQKLSIQPEHHARVLAESAIDLRFAFSPDRAWLNVRYSKRLQDS